MTLETLLLLRKCLAVQQMSVGDPAFVETAKQVIAAIVELDAAIEEARIA